MTKTKKEVKKTVKKATPKAAKKTAVKTVKKETKKTVKKATAKAVKKAATKTVKKEPALNNEPKWLIRFKSYSYDKFYMLTGNKKLFDSNGKLKITAEKFCKQYVSYEYECWKGQKFKYTSITSTPVNSKGIATFINIIGGPFIFSEEEKIDTTDMPENEAIFSDDINYVH